MTKSLLKQLPDTHMMPNLMRLNFSHNLIERLERAPNSLARLSSRLETIDLSHNRISFISRDFFATLNRLSYLLLADNNLRTLSLEFNLQLVPLTQISLDRNPQLARIHNMEFNGKRSVRLFVSLLDTSLATMPTFKSIDPALATFTVSYKSPTDEKVIRKTIEFNHLGETNASVLIDLTRSSGLNEENFNPSDVQHTYEAATRLVLDNQEFQRLPNFSPLSLRSLSMRFNRIERLDDPKLLPEHVRELDFSHNRINSVSVGFFANFPILESISLEHNHLKKLVLKFNPPDEHNPISLSSLELANNQLEDVKLDLEGNGRAVALLDLIDLSSNNLEKFPAISGRNIIGNFIYF